MEDVDRKGGYDVGEDATQLWKKQVAFAKTTINEKSHTATPSLYFVAKV